MAEPNKIFSHLRVSQIYRIRGLSSLFYPNPDLSPENTFVMRNSGINEKHLSTTRLGINKWNTTQITETAVAKPARGIFYRVYLGGAERVIELAGTKIYTDDGTTRTDITGALTIVNDADALGRSVYIDDKEIITDGVSAPFYVGPTGNGAAITGTQFTKCEDFATHRNFLVAANLTESGTKHGTRIRWCDVDTTYFTDLDINTWPTAHVYDLYEDGPQIIGMDDNFGRLLVFKGDGCYPCRLEFNNGVVELVIDEDHIQRGFSPIAKCSIISRPEFTWVVARDGAYIVQPDLSVVFISRNFQSFWKTLNPARLSKCVSYLREDEHQVRTLIPDADTSSGNDQIMVWNWDTNDFWIETPPVNMVYGATYRSSSIEYDLYGNTTGYVYKGNSGTTDDAASDILWAITMSPNDLGFPGYTKEIVNFRTIVKSQASQNSISLGIIRDQGFRPTKSLTVNIGSALQWNSGFQWNDGLSWPGGTTEFKQSYVGRFAETIAPSWSGSGDASIVGYQVEFKLEEGQDGT